MFAAPVKILITLVHVGAGLVVVGAEVEALLAPAVVTTRGVDANLGTGSVVSLTLIDVLASRLVFLKVKTIRAGAVVRAFSVPALMGTVVGACLALVDILALATVILFESFVTGAVSASRLIHTPMRAVHVYTLV